MALRTACLRACDNFLSLFCRSLLGMGSKQKKLGVVTIPAGLLRCCNESSFPLQCKPAVLNVEHDSANRLMLHFASLASPSTYLPCTFRHEQQSFADLGW